MAKIFRSNKTVLFGLFLAICLMATVTFAQNEAEAVNKIAPATDAKILFIFVDSLRPDTVDDMVKEGRLPNIKNFFYDNGLRFSNFFTTFPSLTVNAYGNFITGKWPSETGLKAQSLFERFPAREKSIWEKIFFRHPRYPRYFNMLNKLEIAPGILKQNKIKTLYDLLGEEFHSSVVPISPSVAPWAWPHVAANDVTHPFLVATEAFENLDEINGDYAYRYMTSDTRGKFFMLWFTELDEEQHRNDWGQFGEARNKMESVDRWIKKIYDGIYRESTHTGVYVILFSDHGSYGGAGGVYNQPYYLGRDFFYDTLKMNVRGPDYTINRPGTDLESYTYIDNMGRGQARIFLPVGDSTSGKWDRPNSLYELEHYGLGPNRQPVNLIDELLNINLEKRNKFPEKTDPHPVEFVFVKLADDLIYIAKQGSEAVIQIETRDGIDRYRYLPVKNVSQNAEGRITYQETSANDPFGFLSHPKFHALPNAAEFLQAYHNDREWLDATYETDYPDVVTALVKSFLWNQKLAKMARSQDPDICLSARPGWNFRIENINGGDHGSITNDAMRATLMISGPGIRKGVESEPHRMIDVAPTIMQILGYEGKLDFDSQPIKDIYEN